MLFREKTQVKAGERALTRYLVWFAFASAVTVRLLFVLTFPLNDLGGDTSTYGAMLRHGTSSLVHAGGYSFLVGLPFRAGIAQQLLGPHPELYAYAVLALQHTIDMAVLVLLYKVTSRIFGRPTGAVAVVFAGTNLQSLGATSATYPEWLQGGLLVISFGLTYYAFAEDRFKIKLALYALAAFALTWCVLVKFNSAVLAFVLVVAVIADAVSVKRKGLVLAICSGVACLTCAFYVVFHHHPSTGAYALTHDKSWVLLTKAEQVFGNRLNPANGLNTRRWLALNAVLPPSYDQAGPGMFSRVDAVPASIREPYRTRYAYLVTADAVAVDAAVSQATLPPTFNLGLSAIPVGYYIGLAESDHLGVRVAGEAVLAEPARYADAVWRGTVQAVRAWPSDSPFPTSVDSLRQFDVTVEESLPYGFIRIKQRPDFSNIPFSYSVSRLWWPGVRLTSFLNAIAPAGSIAVYLAALGTLVALVRVVLLRRVDVRSGAALLLCAVVVVVVVASAATLSFRWKEARLVAPIVSVLAAFAIATMGSLLIRAGTRWRAIVRSSSSNS